MVKLNFNEVQMNTDEIIKMCEKLANKYRRPHMRDDLICEGILSIYERLEVEPEEYPASLYRRANKAMYDFVNLKSKAVTIPNNATAGQISRGISYDGQNYSQDGKKNLSDAILSTVVGFDEEYMTAVQDCTESYERQDYIEKSFKLLTEREREVVYMRYFEDMTQDDIAIFYGVSRQSVSQWESVALLKMSKL